MEFILSHSSIFEILLIFLSFFVGATTRFKIPLLAVVVIIRLLKLYLDTHRSFIDRIRGKRTPVG